MNIATASPSGSPTSARRPKAVSWAEFQQKYLSREDGFKYEWLNGEVAKSSSTDYTQFFIVLNLRNVFERLRAVGKVSGILLSEGDIFFNSHHRRPDVAWLTEAQIVRTSHGENQVPLFVIEIISNKDQMNLVHEKMEDYRKAEVSVVWHIFPKIKQVHVYSGAGLKTMRVCTGDDVCTAAAAIPDFEMTVNAIFEKQPLPPQQ